MGAEFIAEEGVLKGLILSLERGEEWTIGRDPDLCTIVIEDPKTSRQHLRVRKMPEGYLVENLSETVPVLIEGAAIKAPTLLKDRDLVTIGGSVFRFYAEGAPVDYAFEPEFGEESFTQEGAPLEEEKPEEIKEEEEEVPPPEKEEEKLAEVFEEQPAAAFEPAKAEEPLVEEGVFEEAEVPELSIDLTQTTRFILKVIAGPNTGAEFALDVGHEYLVGTDTATCDIVFNDLSVSREHARLSVTPDGIVSIQDLGSRNGVIVDRERVVGTKMLTPNAVVALGTSAFLLIDREAPSETIAAPLFEMPGEAEEEVEEVKVVEEEPVAVPYKKMVPGGTLVLALIIGGLAVLLGIGMVSLLQTREVEFAKKDYLTELEAIFKKYPAVRFTYNTSNGKLFILGHVRTGVEHNELLYQLKGLGFITGIDDNVVNDEAVWQEMNILLSKHTDFKGVSMHSPEAGVFVIGGYLKTDQQAADLRDYLNVNFNYLSLLENQVIVDEEIVEDVKSRLLQAGFGAVQVAFSNGDLQLMGYVNSNQTDALKKLEENFRSIAGIRTVRNFVVAVPPEQEVIDLNHRRGGALGPGGRRFQPVWDINPQFLETAADRPQRYRVTGYSKHGDVNINVVINGKIVTRGDCIDGYTVTGIQPHAVFLERDGLKFKIEYNTCKTFGCEE